MNNCEPIGMDDRAKHSGPRSVSSRIGGRVLLAVLVAGTGILVATQILAQGFGGQPERPRDTPAQSKYPPAKPGALVCEPLKAA